MKVGDYVRTKQGIIGKIQTKNYIGYSDWIIDTLYYNDDEVYKKWTCGIKEYNIIKSSPNIIDLIEVGDYVNGWRVMEKTDDYFFIGDESEGTWHLLFDDIKTIVTKEQFESMEYKVGD